MRSYKQRIARLSRQLELADHLATNMDLDTKLATMEADGLPLYLPSQQVLAPGHTDGSGKVGGATSTSPHNPTALRLLKLYRDTASQLKRQRKGGLPCKGTSCLSRSFDESKRCMQHPELANLLVELKRTRRWFTYEYWCHGPQDWLYIHGTPSLMSPQALVRELLAELGSTPLGVLRPLRQQCIPRLQRPLERRVDAPRRRNLR